jgi:hypothetical protein
MVALLAVTPVSVVGEGRETQSVKLCPSVPGAGCISEPGPDTPVPSQFQQSYAVYLRMKAAARGGTQYHRGDYAKMPDWSGLWTRGDHAGLRFDVKQKMGPDGELGMIPAELTPQFDAAYKEKLRQVAKGNEWDQLSDCLPAGYPRALTEPFLREFIVTPGETWWINEQQSEIQRIYTDGRGHMSGDEAKPLWDGDSIGFWDGDTLVVHTIRVTHGQYQRSQPDYSESTSTVSRIRMNNPNSIEVDLTVWDPKGLKKPWHVINHYERVTTPHARIDMWSCEQNNNVVRTPEGASQFILPGETLTIKRSYREPETFYLTDAQRKIFADEIRK